MPWDKSKYPDNWPDIRQQVLERDDNRCKFCGVPNYAVGYRDGSGSFQKFDTSYTNLKQVMGFKVVRIILTIAHVNDPDPSNCDLDNLAALCQRCHLRLDLPQHMANAANTRRKKREAKRIAAGQLSMFEEVM